MLTCDNDILQFLLKEIFKCHIEGALYGVATEWKGNVPVFLSSQHYAFPLFHPSLANAFLCSVFLYVSGSPPIYFMLSRQLFISFNFLGDILSNVLNYNLISFKIFSYHHLNQTLIKPFWILNMWIIFLNNDYVGMSK